MKYDKSISETIPLHRVLDELILDDTPRNVIVSFLKSHAEAVEDIYANSAFVFDLYDLYQYSPSDFGDFLIENAIHLRKSDLMFFVQNFTQLLSVSSNYWDKAMKLKSLMEEKYRGEFMFGRYGGWNWRLRSDDSIIEGGDTIQDVVSRIKEAKDMKTFIIHSRFSRNLFQAKNFLSMDAYSQCLFLNALFDNKNYTYRDNYSEKFRNVSNILAEMTTTLLKQLLVVENVEMFNWMMNITKKYCGTSQENDFMLSVREMFAKRVPRSVMKLIWSAGNTIPLSDVLPEAVFEMNLLETQFEPMDLFLYLYLLPREVATDMFTGKDNENLYLLDFFNLPFNWKELEYFK